MEIIKRLLFGSLKSFISLILMILAATSFLWYVWWLGILLILVIFFMWKKPRRLAVIFLSLAILTLPFSFQKISSQMDYLGDLIIDHGAEVLTTSERLSIYLGNISMALVGFLIIAPEVSIETLLLMDPRAKDRNFNSNFAMKSPHITNIISRYTEKVKLGQVPLKSERIPLRWGEGYNTYSMFDYRVALALAGGGLFLNYEKTEGSYKVHCKITIHVKYSEPYKLDLLNFHGIRLYIDEAIFSGLQDIGWFHPYFAHYHWTLDT